MERILEVIISMEATQYEYLKFFSSDTNKVKFKFIGIDTSNCNATLSVTDSKNNTKEYIVDSSFVFNVPTSLLADRYSCNLKLYNTINQRVTAYPFYLYIDQEPTPKTPIESDTNYPVLGSLINEVRELESTVNFNENTRNTNEAERILTENTRKANEIKRETAYKEITDLRKGVDGNVYKSANDRVNHEVDQLQTQISNASNLPFSGEYISAEHSVKGVCKDMVVKGKTLFNLISLNNRNWEWSGILKKTTNEFECTGSVTYPNIIAAPNFRLTEGKTYTMIVYVKANIKPINSFVTYRIRNQDGTNNNFGEIRISELDKLSQGIFLKSSFVVKNYDVEHQFEGIQFGLSYTNASDGKGCLITFKPMLLEGDWTNKEIPSYFEGIKSVSETSNKISILSCGKNLVKFKDDVVIIDKAQNTGEYYSACNFNIQKNKSYFLKAYIEEYIKKDTSSDTGVKGYIKYSDNSLQYFALSRDNSTGIKTTRFTTESKDIIGFVVYIQKQTCYENGDRAVIKNVMLSDSDSDFQPYKEDKRDISLLKGLREWDSIDFNNAELVTGSRQVILNGSGEITINKGFDNSIIFRIHLTEDIKPKESGFVFCDNFKTVAFGSSYTSGKEGISCHTNTVTNTLYLCLDKTRLSGYMENMSTEQKIELCRKWLQANNLKVCFEVNIPTKTKIQGLDAMTSYNSITHVFTNEVGEISPNIECKIPCNTPAVIQSLSARNTVLQEENKALNNALEDNKLNSLSTNVDQEYRLLKLEMGV